MTPRQDLDDARAALTSVNLAGKLQVFNGVSASGPGRAPKYWHPNLSPAYKRGNGGDMIAGPWRNCIRGDLGLRRYLSVSVEEKMVTTG